MLNNYSDHQFNELFQDGNYKLMITNCFFVMLNELNRRCILINDYSLASKLKDTFKCIDENIVVLKKSSSAQIQPCNLENEKKNSNHDFIQSSLKTNCNWKINILLFLVSIAVSFVVFRFYLKKN